MSEPKTLAEKIAKLPAWAREHIETLDRERHIVVREMTDFLDNQSKSPIFVESSMTRMAGELRPMMDRVYVQSDQITVEAHGVLLRIYTKGFVTHDCSIALQWGSDNDRGFGGVAMEPASFNTVRLVAKDKMR